MAPSEPQTSPGTSQHEDSIDFGNHEIQLWESGDEIRMVIPLAYILDRGANSQPSEPSRTTTFDCPVCEDLTSDLSSRYAKWVTKSLAELEASSLRGCKYCELLSQGIRACIPDCELHDETRLLERLARVLPQGTALPPPNKYGISVFKLRDSDFNPDERAIPVGLIPSGDSESSGAILAAQSWLHDCVSNHKACGTREQEPSPTRLVDVSPSDTLDVKLVQLGEMPCKYACLSHCWGQTAGNQTTIATLEDRLSLIPWSSLCVTFQDAITITRRLGIKYLWIDSLCIIQDSKDDWERESAQMASIYGTAYITIAATKSPDHDGGCFSRMSSTLQTHRISVQAEDGSDLILYFRQMIPHCHSMIQSTDQALEFPLLDRGWVYQERLLSPRVLHFGNNEISWECMEMTKCECGDPNGVFMTEERPPFQHQLVNKSQRPKIAHGYSLREGCSLELLSDRWHEIVQEYSALKLSFQKDTLPALSGLARQMHRYRPHDGYLTGLWVKTLLYDMLWASENDRAPRPAEWRGPSWSWISTTSPVNYQRANAKAIIELYPEVKFYARTLAGNSEYGEVKRPTCVKLTGRLLPAKLRYVTTANESRTAGCARPPDYEIILNGKSIGVFDADFALKLEDHIDHVSDGFAVQLLLMAKSDNNFFYIALIKVELIKGAEIKAEQDRIIVQERIGLLSRSRAYPPLHGYPEAFDETVILR
ncbi:heterokaryon incompatibility protein-domain-containing protein [Ilyonectria destructans]|nr:heterokaryon incompatibility protein-domain-containing protein [Ilyonectria destructans]